MSSVLTRIDGAVATVTLNRPDVHNAFDEEMIADLCDTFIALAKPDGVRVVVLKAEGKSFSAGGDLGWMQRAAGYTQKQNVADARNLGAMLHALHSLPKPTIALVQGAAYGGGVGLVAACDVAIGVERAKFCLSEVKLGLIPSVISPYVLAAMGSRAARRYFLTAEVFGAAEAHRIGLLHEVVADDAALAEKANTLITTLLQNGPEAVAAAKNLIFAMENRPIGDEVVEETAHIIAARRASAEGKEGIKAFLEKRKPTWAGEV